MKVEQFRADLRAWLDEHDLTPGRTTPCKPT